MKLKAIIFDFDGTLANTAPGIILTMKETYRTMGLPIPDDEAIRQTIGLPLIECVRRLGSLPDDEAQKGVEIYRSLFPTFELNHITLFPEVSETIRTLSASGLRLAICTSRGRNSLERILSRYDLWDCFETAVTATDDLAPKPEPDMVLALLDRMGLKADEAIVVGDTTYDIKMGTAAGCRAIAVSYGNHSRAQLSAERPTAILDHFSEILLHTHD